MFQHDGSLASLDTKLIAVVALSQLDEQDRGLFKQEPHEKWQIALTEAPIFHPQGGGQPSDTGFIKSSTPDTTFEVIAARTSVTKPGLVLHLGCFLTGAAFAPGTAVTQEIDTDQRLIFSKYHTAGHVLGAAVRHLLQDSVEGFDELKASHFPATAACEFAGLIAGTHKDSIQSKVDEYITADMPVEIDWWTAEDFKANGLERLTPDVSFLLEGETKFRVVKIVGAEVYPCGGTHVESTKLCGKTTVRKIGRSKGTTRVSYVVG